MRYRSTNGKSSLKIECFNGISHALNLIYSHVSNMCARHQTRYFADEWVASDVIGDVILQNVS